MSQPKLTIGLDEAGRGSLAGPVVAAACAFDRNDPPSPDILAQLDDSKKLTKLKRQKVFKLLLNLAYEKPAKIFFGVGLVDNYTIDEINIRQATKLAMQRAIDELFRKININDIRTILVDGKDAFQFKGSPKETIAVIDGDAKINEIKAASIIAKVFRDHLMKAYSLLYPEFSLDKHNGYGTRLHRTVLEERAMVSAIHRTTFAPIKHILKKKPKILIHVCCGPDACIPFVDLKKDYDIIGFWYDPNIQPKTEYDKRLQAFKKVCDLEGVPFVEGEYDVQRFFELIKGLEHTPEMAGKCEVCYEMRLLRSVIEAQKHGCDFWTTTLNASPKKCYEKLTKIGLALQKQYNIKYLPIAFRKNDGFLRAVQYTEQNNIYRQTYCGCVYSDTYPGRNGRFDKIRGVKEDLDKSKLPVFVG